MDRFVIRKNVSVPDLPKGLHAKRADAGTSGTSRSTTATLRTRHESSSLSDSEDFAEVPLDSHNSENEHSEAEEVTRRVKKRKLYERKFKQEWTKVYSWLEYNDIESKAFCKACRKCITSGFKHLGRHSESIMHKKNIQKANKTPKIDNYCAKNDESIKNVRVAELKLTMFLHEHNLPFLLMDHLILLLSVVCFDSKIAKALKCARTKTTHLTHCIAEEQLHNISQKLQNQHFSLIIDETTDISKKKSLIIVARYFDVAQNKCKDAFLGLIRVFQSDAESSFKAICDYLQKLDIPITMMLGLAADNASVMMGNISGVQARFKSILPNLFVLGCVCHSFHLCSSAAAKKLLKDLENLIRSIFAYFSHSSKRIEKLEEFQKFMESKPHKMLHPSQTRCLSLQIILMSATLNSEAFSKYYNNAPHVNIPGFTFPVQEYFLEDVLQWTGFKFMDNMRQERRDDDIIAKEFSDYVLPYLRQLEAENKYNRQVISELRKPWSDRINLHLIFELLVKLCSKGFDDGAILVFVPGFADISSVCKKMTDSKLFPASKYIVIPLHSQLATVEQKQIFMPAPAGKRKIIISTNIAETSITIDDVTTVIDSGYIKISSLDPETGIESLKTEWVSQANALQRKGRAGRVKAGVCYHLITKIRYKLLEQYLKPEVLRKRLDDVILQLKMLQLGPAQPFLAKLMDPPDSNSVLTSLVLLERLGALDQEEGLTPLGFHMAKLPVGAQCSKMLILGALFSCLDPILSVAASLDFKEAYQLSLDDPKKADKAKYELSQGTNSDHLCMHYAIRGFEDAANPYRFCQQYYLNRSTLKLLVDMRKQFAQLLYDMKFIKNVNPRSPSNNYNCDNLGLIKAIISSGLYPNVAILCKVSKFETVVRSVSNERMVLHPKSVLRQTKSWPSPLLVYYIRLKSKALYVHDATVVFSLPIVFFGDKFKIHINSDKEGDDNCNGISVNGTMRFICSESTAHVIQQLRSRLSQILEWNVAHPGYVDWTRDTPEVKILRLILHLIATEDSDNFDLSDYDDT